MRLQRQFALQLTAPAGARVQRAVHDEECFGPGTEKADMAAGENRHPAALVVRTVAVEDEIPRDRLDVGIDLDAAAFAARRVGGDVHRPVGMRGIEPGAAAAGTFDGESAAVATGAIEHEAVERAERAARSNRQIALDCADAATVVVGAVVEDRRGSLTGPADRRLVAKDAAALDQGTAAERYESGLVVGDHGVIAQQELHIVRIAGVVVLTLIPPPCPASLPVTSTSLRLTRCGPSEIWMPPP